jgi:hypothetical protein
MRLAVVAPLAFVTGCAVRTPWVDHYLGPVLYRSLAPCRDGAELSQVVAAGALAEVGRQAGLSLGVVDRVAVVPREAGDGSCGGDRSRAVLGVPADPAPRRWAFSPFYLRVQRTGEVRLSHRVLTGMQAVVGPEATALSLGGVAATLVRPPTDAFCAIRFDASRPMETRFTVWTVGSGASVPEQEILEEVTR